MLYIFQQQVSFCWETQHTALVIVTVREVLKQIISRKSDKHALSHPCVHDGAAKAKLCLTAPGWQSASPVQEMGVRREGGEGSGAEARQAHLPRPWSPAKGPQFRTITSDRFLGQGRPGGNQISRAEVLAGHGIASAATDKQSLPGVHS